VRAIERTTRARAWLDQAGHPESDALHLVERFHRPDFEHMALEMIVGDSKMHNETVDDLRRLQSAA
jgi:hypothetical protein